MVWDLVGKRVVSGSYIRFGVMGNSHNLLCIIYFQIFYNKNVSIIYLYDLKKNKQIKIGLQK